MRSIATQRRSKIHAAARTFIFLAADPKADLLSFLPKFTRPSASRSGRILFARRAPAQISAAPKFLRPGLSLNFCGSRPQSRHALFHPKYLWPGASRKSQPLILSDTRSIAMQRRSKIYSARTEHYFLRADHKTDPLLFFIKCTWFGASWVFSRDAINRKLAPLKNSCGPDLAFVFFGPTPRPTCFCFFPN